jgi:hypothetical protein
MLVTRQVHTEHEVLKWMALLALAAALIVIFARQIHGTICDGVRFVHRAVN